MSPLSGHHIVKRNEIIQGDALAILKGLPDESVQVCGDSVRYGDSGDTVVVFYCYGGVE